MTDVLIRDVPDEVLAAIDAQAKRLGLSRTEYLRRTLERESTRDPRHVTVEHVQRLAELTTDLNDPDIMSGAWE